MVKHQLKNITEKNIYVEDTGKYTYPGSIVEAELTTRNRYLISNKVLEDCGAVPTNPIKSKEEGKEKDVTEDQIDDSDNEDNTSVKPEEEAKENTDDLGETSPKVKKKSKRKSKKTEVKE